MKKVLLGAMALTVAFASCKTEEAEKFDYSKLTAQTNYVNHFKDKSGNTTVSNGGQATRIKMLDELIAYMKSSKTAMISKAKVMDMLKNQNSPFADAALNSATTKKIFNKIAAAQTATIKDQALTFFEGRVDELVALSNTSVMAEPGVAGKITQGSKTILVNAKGLEVDQAFYKGLYGAFMMDQIANAYLGDTKQNVDNSKPVDGKNYTVLEHHWDEAYGYLTSNDIYPKPNPSTPGKFLEKHLGGYVRQVPNPADLYLDFLRGRQAVVYKDDATRKESIAKIRKHIEKCVATVAVSYMNKTITAGDNRAKFHALSEAYGFIYGLRFAHNPKTSPEKSDALLQQLVSGTNGFWSLTNEKIKSVRNELATAHGVDPEIVVNH